MVDEIRNRDFWFEATLVMGDRSVVHLVSDVKGKCRYLLCCDDCICLEVVSINESKFVRNVHSTSKHSDKDTKYREEIFAKYPKVFSSIGRLKGYKVKLSFNPNQSVKNIGISNFISRSIWTRSTKLIDDDVLEPVTDPMPWDSQLLAPTKPGYDGKAITEASQMRLVADRTASKKANLRDHRVKMTTEELAL